MKKLLSIFLLILSFTALKAEEKIIACDNSLEMFDWAFEFIDKAEQSIEFAPCYFGGELFQKMMGAFEKQMKRFTRLQIHIIFEGTFLEPADKALLERMKQDYSRQFHPLLVSRVVDIHQDLIGISNHMKMLVIDETYYTFGGSNYDYVISSEGTHPEKRRIKEGVMVANMLPNGSRDQDIVGKGPMAKKLRRTFYNVFALWEDYQKSHRFTSKNPEDFSEHNRFKVLKASWPIVERFEQAKNVVTIDSDRVKLVMGGPWKRPNNITEEYLRLINLAEQQIFVGNLYFAPIDQIMEAFQNASKRGVMTQIITNGINDQAPPYTVNFAYANRIHFLPILKGRTYTFFEKGMCKKHPDYNAHFYEYYVKDIVYHKKMMLVDNRYFLIGCYNLDVHSDIADYELVMVIDSPELAKEAAKIAKRDLEHSFKLSEEVVRDWYFDPAVRFKANLQKKSHTLI